MKDQGVRFTIKLKLTVGFGVLAVCSLATVLVGLTGAGSTGSSSNTLVAVLGAVGLLVSVGTGVAVTRQISARVRFAEDRLDAIAVAISERLKPAIEALAAGDLTVDHLSLKTQALTDLPNDEIRDIMRTGERTRDAISGCYTAYNEAVTSIRKLVADVTSTAVSVGDSSHQMAVRQLITAIQNETASVVHVVEDGAAKTADGATVVDQAREAFVTIGQAVEDMSSRIEQIAAAAQQITASASTMQESIVEAASVAEESSASSEQVSASTQETSASTEQVAATAAEMAASADALRGLVGRFRLESANQV
jgi:methyl-accepting chemotaxis protein